MTSPANPSIPLIGSAFHAKLFEVKFTLYLAQRLVVDLASVAQIDHGVALGRHDRELYLLMLRTFLCSFGRLVVVVRVDRRVLAPVFEPGLKAIDQGNVAR